MVDCDIFCYCTNVLFDTQLFLCYKICNLFIVIKYRQTNSYYVYIHINIYIIYLP